MLGQQQQQCDLNEAGTYLPVFHSPRGRVSRKIHNENPLLIETRERLPWDGLLRSRWPR